MKQCLLLCISIHLLLLGYSQTNVSPDQNFAGKGWTIFRAGQIGNNYAEEARQVLRQADGKYIMVIELTNNFTVVARFKPDGLLDSSYGGDGFTDDINMYQDCRVAIQHIDGEDKVVLAGNYLTIYGDADYGLLRFNYDGSVDTSFGTNGRVITDLTGTRTIPMPLPFSHLIIKLL